MAAILDFKSKWIKLFFGRQVTLRLPTMFQVNWPFGSREEIQNKFSRWPPWKPS